VETREVFWALETAQVLLFYAAGIMAMAVFGWGIYRHIAKYRRGRSLTAAVNLVTGVGRMTSDVLSHRMLRRRDGLAGLAHAGIFFGFLFGAVGTALIFLEVDFLKPMFGITFWKGGFYLVFSLVLDLGHLAMVLGLVLMMWRRAAFGLGKLDYRRAYAGEEALRPTANQWRAEDWIFMAVLLLIEMTGFLQEGVRLLMDQPAWSAWSPVGNALAAILATFGMEPDTAQSIRAANWWIHGFLGLAFTAAVPWYKAKHMIAVLGSLSVRDAKALRRLPKEDDEASHAGVATVSDFTWKDMLHFDACTKCGRCHEACPASTVGYPLSPRDLILDLRLYNDRCQGTPGTDDRLIGGVINAETLWACRSCGACQEICPVGIEHPAIIVRMRRHLVEQGNMDPLLQATLNTIADTGNSFGENARKRSAWTRELGFKVKDIRDESADNLWFVGDYASFDPRNQNVGRAFAGLLKTAEVDFALLHEGERTAGNDVRRVGEEGLFESLVEHNLDQMAAAQPFRRIITTDPHSYNTLRNEYPEFGDVAAVEHYSTLLAELLAAGRLEVTKPLGKRVTFHDPCHLGRLNGGYDAPREVLRRIGCEIVEMPRNRDNSFCCGAGGGRIWIPDTPGIEKPSENRMHEAAGLGPIDIFVTCCPKDLTMFEDARKTSGHEGDFVVLDLAELVAEAVELERLVPQDIPLPEEPAAEPVAAEAPLPEPATAAPAALSVALAPMDWDNLQPVQAAELEPYEVPAKDGPRILVMVKHAAVLGDEHAFTEDGRDIESEYLEHTLNEWDDSALEEALLVIEKVGSGEVVAVAVGPEDADVSLRKVLAKGAHRAVRVWHDSLAGADPVTIARAIAGVARREEPALIFAGVQSSDHAHGATGAALARILGLPNAAVVIGIEWDGASKLTVTRELEGGTRHTFKMPSPAVLSIQTGINKPRYATMRMIKQAKKKPLVVLDGATVPGGGGGYAVRRMYVPEQAKAEMLSGNAEEIAAFIAGVIREKMGD
jgi:Fe-S oxidoreductase/electron transfer flavoprotein alpha/beta subunit